MWLREKDSNLHLRVQSPTCCRLHYPGKNSGHWDSNPEPCANLALTPLIRRLLCRVELCPVKLVAANGVEPSSLDYQSSALPLCYTAELVDPTGLKPAPHGLKGRRSVTRAPSQKNWLWRKDSNLRMAALTVRCLTNLATPQEIWRRRRESNPYRSVYKTDALITS
jgi:hypothetical protein